MADQTEQTQQSNGAVSREEWIARDRAAFLAGEDVDADEGGSEVEQPTKKPAAKPAPSKPVEVDDEDEASETVEDDEADVDDDADETSADEDEDIEADDEDEDADDEPKRGKEDPETAKRIAHVRKLEQRSREKIARERTDFERERQQFTEEMKSIRASAAEFERLKSRARYEPEAVLAALGLSEDDYVFASRRLYALSKDGKADPKNKAAADQLSKEREYSDKLTATEKKLAEMEAKLEQKAQQEAAQREAAEYIENVHRAVDESAPLLQRQLAKNPGKAFQSIAMIADELAGKNGGKLPDPKKVIRVYEKRRRAELEELGVDVAAIVKTAPKTAAKNGDKKTAATGKAAKVEPKSARSLRDEIIADLEAGEFD